MTDLVSQIFRLDGILPVNSGTVRVLADEVRRLSAENAALKVDIERHVEISATLLQQRNEASERAAEVADGFADRSLHHYHAVKIAAAIRNLSKES